MKFPMEALPATSPPKDDVSRWFTEEIQPHEPRLRAWLRTKFPHLHDLDDIVQETYLRLVRAKGRGKWENPRAYLFTTARNAALDRCRRQRVVEFERIPDSGPASPADDPALAAEAAHLDFELSTLTEAIRALPDRCREVLVLRKLHGLSHREIAAQLGIAPNTVNAQLTAAMIKCRGFFQHRGLLETKTHEAEKR